EWADDGEDAVWSQDRLGVDGGVPEIAHRVFVAVVVLHRLGVVADQVRRLLDLTERLDPVLADLVALCGGVLEETVADQLRGAPQDRQPLPPGRRAPAGLPPPSRGDR